MKTLSPTTPKLLLTKTVIIRFKRPAVPAGFISTSLVTSSIIGGDFAR